MENKKGFCTNCLQEVEYFIKEKELTGNIKGKDYRYMGKEATCQKCGSLIWTQEIHDYNLEKLWEEYRKQNNIISKEQIEKILSKYNISKRNLSKVLGWGELTITRYLNGSVPTKEYSTKLKKILEDDSYYFELLENGKETIVKSAYKKSLALKKEEEISKIDRICEYILVNGKDITQLSIQKLLYYIQGFYNALYNEEIFDDNCEAWVYGPVYPKIYNKYKKYKYDKIEIPKFTYTNCLNEKEKEVIDNVIRFFGCYNGKTLVSLTHTEDPFIQARNGKEEDENSNEIISKESIHQYFESVVKKYNITKPEDIKNYSKDLFEKIVIFA